MYVKIVVCIVWTVSVLVLSFYLGVWFGPLALLPSGIIGYITGQQLARFWFNHS